MKKLIAFSLLSLSFTALGQNTPEKNNPSPGDVTPVAVPRDGYMTENSVYNVAGIETKPDYPGGVEKFYQFIAKHVKVSEDEAFTGGKIFASFVIEKDGTLTDIKIIRDKAGFGMAEEVTRVLKMSPKWTPGQQAGKPVRVHYSIPVTIAMPEAEKTTSKKK